MLRALHLGLAWMGGPCCQQPDATLISEAMAQMSAPALPGAGGALMTCAFTLLRRGTLLPMECPE